MDFQHSARSLELQERVRQFMLAHVEPVEELYYEQVKAGGRALQDAAGPPGPEAAGTRAGALEPVPVGEHGQDPDNTGLTNLEYAPVKEIMGRVLLGARDLQLLGARCRQHGGAGQLRHRRRSRSAG